MSFHRHHRNQGAKVNAEHARSAKAPSRRTGFFAVLSDSLGVAGTGAPASLASSSISPASLMRLSAAFAMLLIYLALPSAASAARGHVFKETFGTPCAAEPCGPGELKHPSALAVNEETHDVYVADQEAGKGRVELFSAAGAFLSEITGPAATGSGELTSGSVAVTGLATTAGAFTPGEQITAPGIEAGTTIAAAGPGSLELSAPATATETAALSASQPFAEPLSIAIDNSALVTASPSRGDLYVADEGNRVVDKFSAGGEYLGQITESPIFGGAFHCVAGLTLDNAGRLLLAEANFGCASSPEVPAAVDTYSSDSPNLYLPPPIRFDAGFFSGFGLVPGFAFDSEGNFYIDNAGGGNFASKFSGEGKQLVEHFGPENPTGLVAESPSNDVYVGGTTGFSRLTSGGSLIEQIALPGSSPSGSGITLDQAAGTIYQGDAGSGRVAVFVTEPPSPPTIESEGLSAVTSTSANFVAEINPRGVASKYRFEYGPCTTPSTCATSPYATAVPVPDGLFGADFEVHAVAAHPQDLQPGTTYHLRVVATNEANAQLNTVTGTEKIFTTQSVPDGSPLLPDARQWELVSPPDKRGGTLTELGGPPEVIQAAADGRAITYVARASTEPDPAANANFTQVLSRRTGGGWRSQDINTPHATIPGLTDEGYKFFSTDLSRSIVESGGEFEPQISPQASEQTPYLRSNFPPGQPEAPCASSCYTPLVTGAPGFANVPPGTVFGSPGCAGGVCGPAFRGATADLSHVIVQSQVPLTETTPPAATGGLYEWTAGHLTLVSLLPQGEGGGPAARFTLGNEGNGLVNPRGAISSDGSRVVWGNDPAGTEEGHLFLTDTVRGATLRLDAVKSGLGEGPAVPRFQLASPDGSTVLFTDSQRLTADSGAGPGKKDLYRCQISETGGGELQCALTDLTPIGAGESPAEVQGDVIGASPDGSAVYFVANGALAGGATLGNCGSAGGSLPPERTACNLYIQKGGINTLVAVLSGRDSFDWAAEPGAIAETAGLRALTARVSPDGGWLAFMSQRALTGYDNLDAISGQPDQEAYLYRAPTAAGEEGRLLCASCNPTGARPRGLRPTFETLVSKDEHLWISANVPGWVAVSGIAVHQPRYLSNGGRLFFNSFDALVPQDSNATADVYEFEPPGLGDCTTSSPNFAPASSGCIGLISSGTSAGESAFLDASESGEDAFFLTAGRLSRADADSTLDVYDARVGGSEAEPVQPVRCAGDACQQPAVPPAQLTPGTSLVNGPGNVVQCTKGRVKKLGKCVAKKHKKAHKKHHKAKHKRANTNRRASR